MCDLHALIISYTVHTRNFWLAGILLRPLRVFVVGDTPRLQRGWHRLSSAQTPRMVADAKMVLLGYYRMRIGAHTNVGLSKEATTLCCGRWRRRILELRGGGSARLAHGVCAMHDGRVKVSESTRNKGCEICGEEEGGYV